MVNAQWCDYCNHLNITKTIKRPASFVKRFDKKYIHVCPSCLEKYELQNIPEYIPSKLQNFVDYMENRVIKPVVLRNEEQEYMALVDNHANLLDIQNMRFIAHELLKTVEIDSLNDFIKEQNLKNQLTQYEFPYDNENGLFLLPKPYIDKRKVRDNLKSNWGFTCNWCGYKWSSKTQDRYFVTGFDPMGFGGTSSEMACSEVCASHIYYELAKNWVHDKGYAKFFHLD